MQDEPRETLPPNTSDFVTTRCRICAAGQTITRDNGIKGTYCLLLRDWMTGPKGQPLITDCDRYEPKERPGR
jgi:hypothetical protein